jgi:hypothetical protein
MHLLVGRGPDEVTLKDSEMEYVTHQARRIAQDPRKCLEDLHCRADAAYQSPIAIAIFFESFLPSWSSWRMASGEFDCSSVAAKDS